MKPLIRQLSNAKSHYFLGSRGVNYEYRIKGDPSHDAIVMLHNLGMDCRVFLPNIDALAEDFLVVVISFRGHGLSDKPKSANSESYGLAALVQDVIELTWNLEIQNFHLVGHGMGAIVGYEILKQDPDSLLSLTSISAPVSNGALKELHKFSGKVNGFTSRLLKQKQLAGIAAKFVSDNDETISYVRDEIFYGTDFKILKHFKNLIDEANYVEVLRESRLPILIIEGESDFVTEGKNGKKAIQDMLELISDNYPVGHEIIPNTGHIPSLDNPEAFNRILGNFVRSI